MTLAMLYGLFVKYGFLCFGGGYALVPLLTAELVQQQKLMTAEEFGRLLGVAQITPGPIGINTATYVGFTQCGIIGGIAGTLGLVTPALILVILAYYFLKRWEKTVWVRGIFAALRPAAFGMLLTAILVFAEISIFTGPLPLEFLKNRICGNPAEWDFSIRFLPLLIAAASMLLQLKTKLSFLWLIAGAAGLGALFL
ncbi:MAG: chromate transporter [Lentisphaeria bacterium]|nr:chromate transporter [Lentisphaeria bacterium]